MPESGDQHDRHRLAERVRLRVRTWGLKAEMAASDGGFKLRDFLQLWLDADPLDQGLPSADHDYGQQEDPHALRQSPAVTLRPFFGRV